MFNLAIYEYFEDINLGLVKYMPSGKKILDVGCGQGMLGKVYRRRKNYVVGIDLAPAVTSVSDQRLDEFYREDITDFKKIAKILGKRKFDVIIFADVLEHIYDPVAAVLFYKQFIKKNGRIYISVPNFVVWNNRFHVFFGKYQYTDVGTRDKTHVRMFTLDTVMQFADATKLHIEHLDITPGIAKFFIPNFRSFFKKHSEDFDRSAIIDSGIYKFYANHIYPLEYYTCKIWPGFLAFQYIVILKPLSATP